MEQISFFDGSQKYKIRKPIRLIELFGGIGAQASAIKRLQVQYESYRYCEIDKYTVKAYNAIHGTDFEPTDITKLHADDLGVIDTDKYDYIMTYSFPCQDLSNAGLQRGMTKGSGTRSGLLWEVERLLTEMTERPQILLMENVPQVIGKNAIKDFALWNKCLEELGYKNYWRVLNATGFDVPQNRQRCFMLSLLGDYYYTFPEEKPLTKRLKDLLEPEVDEKYYLSFKTAEYFVNNTINQKNKGNGFKFSAADINGIAHSITTKSGGRMDDNFIFEPYLMLAGTLQGGKWNNTLNCNKRVYSIDGICPTLTTMGGATPSLKYLLKQPTKIRL